MTGVNVTVINMITVVTMRRITPPLIYFIHVSVNKMLNRTPTVFPVFISIYITYESSYLHLVSGLKMMHLPSSTISILLFHYELSVLIYANLFIYLLQWRI